MKKFIFVLFVSFIGMGFFVHICSAEITVKQGVLFPWKTLKAENFSCIEFAKTKPIEGLGKWNVLIDGWTLDGGIPYDSGDKINKAAITIGRTIGTLGQCLPFIDFPMLNQIRLSAYPVGLRIFDWDTKLKFDGVFGGAIIGTLKF